MKINISACDTPSFQFVCLLELRNMTKMEKVNHTLLFSTHGVQIMLLWYICLLFQSWLFLVFSIIKTCLPDEYSCKANISQWFLKLSYSDLEWMEVIRYQKQEAEGIDGKKRGTVTGSEGALCSLYFSVVLSPVTGQLGPLWVCELTADVCVQCRVSLLLITFTFHYFPFIYCLKHAL